MRRAILLLLLVVLLPGCSRDRAVWFVQMTDPHFFEDITDPDGETARAFRENLSRDAFTDLMKALNALPGQEGKPDFLVITGDFGIDRFLPQRAPAGPPNATSAITPAPTSSGGATSGEDAAPAAPGPSAPTSPSTEGTPASGGSSTGAQEDRSAPPQGTRITEQDAVQEVARRLRDSPVRDIFFVPGNNDVAKEDAAPDALEATAGFFEAVQTELAGSGVVVHDLTVCYQNGRQPLSKCYFEIPQTRYSLVGFPSHSFKNRDERWYAANQAAQEAQIETLGRLMDLVRAQGRKALLLTHIPELDDPYNLGRLRFANLARPKGNPDMPRASAWNVSPKVLARWNEIIRSETVAGVIAGHFHDSHREIYSPPYRWAADAAKRPALDKLFVAPPLSARLQDTSPIQARGFAAFVLAKDRPRRQLYWYDGMTRTFQPEAEGHETSRGTREESIEKEAGWLERFGASLTSIWTIPNDQESLARAAIFWIALLAAFLTVVQVWQIPPPPMESPGRSSPASAAATTSGGSPGGTTGGTTATATASASGSTTSTTMTATNVFQSNLGKTVASGLTGLAVVVFLDEFWQQTQLNEKAYYLVLFSASFLVMLFVSAGLRGLAEALRSRVVIYRSRSTSVRGVWRWLLSWRSAWLVFLDTTFNVIQGRNQMQSVVFERAIVDLNWSLISTADRVREAVDRALRGALQQEKVRLMDESDVRVSVLVLSDDRQSAFSISSDRANAGPFGEKSTVVTAIRCGKARWCKLDDPKRSSSWSAIYSAAPEQADEAWTASDNRGFLVLPVPWTRISEALDYRPAGLLLSFRDASFLNLWKNLEMREEGDKTVPNYECWRGLLDLEPEPGADGPVRIYSRNPELRAVLRQSLDVLGESLHHFNQTIFEERIRPYRKT
jgi:hypothetical protein